MQPIGKMPVGAAGTRGVLGNNFEKRFGRRRNGALQLHAGRTRFVRVPNFRRAAPRIEVEGGLV